MFLDETCFFVGFDVLFGKRLVNKFAARLEDQFFLLALPRHDFSKIVTSPAQNYEWLYLTHRHMFSVRFLSMTSCMSVVNLNRSNDDGFETTHVTLRSWLPYAFLFSSDNVD